MKIRNTSFAALPTTDLAGAFRKLDEVLREVRQVLNGGVRLEDQCTVRRFQWIEGGGSVAVAVPARSAPLGVALLAVTRMDDRASSTSGNRVTWSYDRSQLVVSAIEGLTTNVQYEVAIAVYERAEG